MTLLIASLGAGKGTWEHVRRLIHEQSWDKAILVTNDFGIENFKCDKELILIKINPDDYLPKLSADILEKLKDHTKGIFEVALNLVSGTGKEHMALLSSLTKLGVGIRLVTLTNSGMQEI